MLGVKKIATRDLREYAWSRLARFQNQEYCSEQIAKRHLLGKKNLQNAKTQAEQVKYCLAQAKEYFQAADVVSLATRPVLLYYAAMSLALAEILMKQTGDSRLPKLRESHPAHGLALKLASDPKTTDELGDAASKLIAKLQYDGAGMPMGTFELWHRSAREYPIGGDHFEHAGTGNTQTFSSLFTPADTRFKVVPKGGLTLLDCVRELPYLHDSMLSSKIDPSFVRAMVKADVETYANKVTLTLVVHPQPEALVEKFGNLCVCTPSLVNELEVQEMRGGGFIATLNGSAGARMTLPPAICLHTDRVFFSSSGIGLNEFGFLYVALHICGNFARYYPDIWLKHLEKSSALALIIDELCQHAFERLPILALSELARSYHILQS